MVKSRGERITGLLDPNSGFMHEREEFIIFQIGQLRCFQKIARFEIWQKRHYECML